MGSESWLQSHVQNGAFTACNVKVICWVHLSLSTVTACAYSVRGTVLEFRNKIVKKKAGNYTRKSRAQISSQLQVQKM